MDSYHQIVLTWGFVIGGFLILVFIVALIWFILGVKKNKIIQDRETLPLKTYTRSEGKTDYVLHGQTEYPVTSIGFDLHSRVYVGEITTSDRPIRIRYVKKPISQQQTNKEN